MKKPFLTLAILFSSLFIMTCTFFDEYWEPSDIDYLLSDPSTNDQTVTPTIRPE